MAMLLSIDGNIGCGKSTLIDTLQKLKETNIIDEHFDMNIINKLVYFQEPINIWNTITTDNKTLLEKYYENQKKYGFCFQMMVLLARITELKKIIKLNPDSIIVMERSFYSDKYIFLDMLYDKKIIDTYNYQIYNLWFESIVKDLPTHYYLYLTSTPERCIEKIKMPLYMITIDADQVTFHYHLKHYYNGKRNISLTSTQIEPRLIARESYTRRFL
jgi:deoxyadenosine/deoxycytidine kinase